IAFKGLRALSHVSFSVGEGRVVALIGPNGAGKTTLFNVIAGALEPDRGDVVFGGSSITGRQPEAICRAGIGRTFQIVRPFADMTVVENVMVGALHRIFDAGEARDASMAILRRFGF